MKTPCENFLVENSGLSVAKYLPVRRKKIISGLECYNDQEKKKAKKAANHNLVKTTNTYRRNTVLFTASSGPAIMMKEKMPFCIAVQMLQKGNITDGGCNCPFIPSSKKILSRGYKHQELDFGSSIL